MSLFIAAQTPTTGRATLTESYRPRTVADFIGLDKPRRMFARFIAAPYDSAWLFVGDPGLGKTSLAIAIANELPAEIHHIASQDCNLDSLRKVAMDCHYYPADNRAKHVVIIDEADRMTRAAQDFLLSKLDGTDPSPNTIWIFTCNSLEGLEPRFVSRCGKVEFSSYGASPKVAEFLADVWTREAPKDADAPNFTRIAKESCGNVRAALMTLQNELLLA